MTSRLHELDHFARQWQVSIESTLETNGSLVAFGLRSGAHVVLKLVKQRGDEWNSGAVLEAFNADGTVRVIEHEEGAVLLERLIPGHGLVEVVRRGDDESATHILAQVMSQMANHAPPLGCPSVLAWAKGFNRYRQTNGSQIPIGLINEAEQSYLRLANSSSRSMLLHGDLHHYNVILDEKRGWVAIDPKGVVGELEFEVGAILRNPVELPGLFTCHEVIERRLQTLTKVLELDYRRALEWSFAQAVLSMIWDLEDGSKVQDSTLLLAETLRAMHTS